MTDTTTQAVVTEAVAEANASSDDGPDMVDGRRRFATASEARGRGIALPDEATINVTVDQNPKRGSAAQRFALYRDNMTVAQAKEAGMTSADLRWDIAHGYIALVHA